MPPILHRKNLIRVNEFDYIRHHAWGLSPHASFAFALTGKSSIFLPQNSITGAIIMFFKNLGQYGFIMALYWPLSSVAVTTNCHDTESLKTLREQGEYIKALDEMDNCLALAVDKRPSKNDLHLFVDLIKDVLTKDYSTSLEEAYQNFESVLGIHLLNKPEFKFAHYFENHPTEKTHLFSEVHQKGEKYYFYYDTGRFFSDARGIALTDKSLIWKNLIGKPRRLAFDEIEMLTLVYDSGYFLNNNLSWTGWKLRINNKNNEIRLSRLPVEALMPFLSAMTYFINFNKTTADKNILV